MTEARDPRLDASGEDHPGVQPSKFDLIALEKTRYGLRAIGLGLLLLWIAGPFVSRHFSGAAGFRAAGWLCWAIGLLVMLVALTITAPTPHGPLPKGAARAYIFLCIVSFSSAIVHLFYLFSSRVEGEASRFVATTIDSLALILFASLTMILWRFCQYRGLSGRAMVWLWLAMAAIAAGSTGTYWHAALWAFPALGLIAFFAAQQTARDVWLDAIYRHSKLFVVTHPKTDVIPLHPADKH